jgi:hypothetical protein
MADASLCPVTLSGRDRGWVTTDNDAINARLNVASRAKVANTHDDAVIEIRQSGQHYCI